VDLFFIQYFFQPIFYLLLFHQPLIFEQIKEVKIKIKNYNLIIKIND